MIPRKPFALTFPNESVGLAFVEYLKSIGYSKEQPYKHVEYPVVFQPAYSDHSLLNGNRSLDTLSNAEYVFFDLGTELAAATEHVKEYIKGEFFPAYPWYVAGWDSSSSDAYIEVERKGVAKLFARNGSSESYDYDIVVERIKRKLWKFITKADAISRIKKPPQLEILGHEVKLSNDTVTIGCTKLPKSDALAFLKTALLLSNKIHSLEICGDIVLTEHYGNTSTHNIRSLIDFLEQNNET